MKRFRITGYYLFLASFLLLSCNSSKKDSAADSAHTDDAAFTTDEPRDPYWQNPTVGINNKQITDKLVKKYNSLLVFHADDTMQVNKTYIASLALARNAPLEPIKMKILEISDATDETVLVDTTIQLGKKMRADLKDFSPRNDKSFLIERIGSDEQVLTNSKEAYWQWNIEPLKAGQHKLKLAIQVVLGDEGEVNLPTKEIPVIIFAQKKTVTAKISNFFSNYWQWIITGIFLPIFIAWLTTRMRHSGETKKK
jgi:hypothetical protein